MWTAAKVRHAVYVGTGDTQLGIVVQQPHAALSLEEIGDQILGQYEESSNNHEHQGVLLAACLVFL